MQCPILFVAVLHLAIGSAAIAAPIAGERLTVATPFSFADKDVRRAVSGIACRKVGARHRCLVAFDEGMKVQFAEVEAKRMKAVGAAIALMPEDGELDAEGAAIDGRYVYVAGSHSVKRKTCAPNPTSHGTLIDLAIRCIEPSLARPGGEDEVLLPPTAVDDRRPEDSVGHEGLEELHLHRVEFGAVDLAALHHDR